MENKPVLSDKIVESNVKLQEERAMALAHNVVTFTMILLGVYMTILFWVIELQLRDSIVYLSLWFFVLIVHMFYGNFSRSQEGNRLISYFSIISLYTLMLGTLIHENIPFLMASLFVIFAIGYLYVDLRAASLNHLMLFVVTNVVLWFYPEVYSLEMVANISTLYISLFIFVMVGLLYAANFIVIKRKLYHFRKLARLQQNEFKVIDFLFDLQERYTDESFDASAYYKRLKVFFEAFSKEADIEDVFSEQIDIIQALDQTNVNELKKLYENIPENTIHELELLTLMKKRRIRHLSMKASQIKNIETGEEYLSDAMFDSMRHYYDDVHIKITVFVAFYVYCRMEKKHEKALSDEEFYSYLRASGISNLVEPNVLEAYLNNRDVFDKVYQDSFKEGLAL